MAIAAASAGKRPPWRTIAFIVVAGLLALMFLVIMQSAVSALSPWVAWAVDPRMSHPEVHRWHNATHGAKMGILMGGSLVALLWRPSQKPLLAQFFLGAVIIITLSEAITGAFSPIPLVIFALLLATYPATRSLVSLASERPMNRLLLGLGLLTVAVLAPDASRNLQLQLADRAGEHGLAGHWFDALQLDLVLGLAALLLATRRPGWRSLGILTGLTLLYLGAAAITLPDQAGSWGMLGGMAAVMGGAAFVAASVPVRQAGARTDVGFEA